MNTATLPESLSSPSEIHGELERLRREIALKSNEFETAAHAWYSVQPLKQRLWADTYVQTDGPGHVRKASADGKVATDDWGRLEGNYLALKARVRSLESQAVICQSLLKQSRFV